MQQAILFPGKGQYETRFLFTLLEGSNGIDFKIP